MRIEANTAVTAQVSRPLPNSAAAFPAYANAAVPGGQAPTKTPYARDSYVPSGYVQQGPQDNVLYGQGKNINIRIMQKVLGLNSSYIEAAFIDKTPEDALQIEEVDFNLQVQAGEVSVSDVDATLTVEQILNNRAQRTGKKLPISQLRVAFAPDNEVDVEGKYKVLGMNIPFAVNGKLDVTTGGAVKYTLGKASVAGISVNGLMKVFGLNLEKLLKLNNPAEGLVTRDNSLYVEVGTLISQQDGAPALQARIRGIRTHLGQLQVLIGERPEDAQRVIDQKQVKEPSYIHGEGGHAYVDGFFVKDGQVSLYDRTPDTPLYINVKGLERSIQIRSGHVAVSENRLQSLITEELAGTNTFTGLTTDLQKDHAKVSGKLFNAIPLSTRMTFGATEDGRLQLSPSRTKVLGFIPVPGGLVRNQLSKALKGSEVVGKGIAMGNINGIDLGHLQQVTHQDNYVVLTSGQSADQNP